MKQDISAMRHSAAHLMAAAVKKLYPKTALGMGPVIENGFYYDFDSNHRFSTQDFTKIEKEIEALKEKDIPFKQTQVKIKEALKIVKEKKESYKEEIVDDLQNKGEKKVSFYQTGDFLDLCNGPHVKTSSEVGAVKLISVAGAYWKGSEKNKMLQRIYGTAWFSKKDLDDYLRNLEEAKQNDHRKLGKELDLFVFSDVVGSGLPLLTSKGTTIKRELERYIVDEETKRGYQHVSTPPLARVELYKKSGHYPYYKESMYPPLKIDQEELILRPMTCPHHFMLYKSRPRSYKELPLKMAEISPQFRYEKSGELIGLARVRMFTLADAHIFTPADKVEGVLNDVLDLITHVNQKIGFEKKKDFYYRLSLGDKTESEKYYKDDKAWEKSENVLRKVLKKRKEPFYEASGEAAFYGPKIDVQMKNVLGKEETIFTVQYDFVMPKRFDLKFINEEGREEEPVVIHRSSIGATERVMAFLIEKTGGAFPLWLSPIQAKIIPISDRHQDYARDVLQKLISAGLRVEIDDRSETMQTKIRDARLQKIPYMLILGDRERAQKKIAVRSRDRGEIGAQTIDEFLETLNKELISK